MMVERNQSYGDLLSFEQGHRSLHPADEYLSVGPRPVGRVDLTGVPSGYADFGSAVIASSNQREGTVLSLGSYKHVRLCAHLFAV
jgi:hypothetical protein